MDERTLRFGLGAFGALNLLTGVLLFFFPHYFFTHIGPYGVENNHYLGDTGSFYLAAGAGLLVAIRRPSWRLPLLAVSTAWYGFHAFNHLTDIHDDNKGTGRGVLDVVLLAIATVALGYLALLASRAERSGPRPPAAARRGDYPPGD